CVYRVWPRSYSTSTMTERFDCYYCRDNLHGKKYVMKDEKHVCTKCFDKLCANTCAECRRPIGADAKELNHKNRHWHEDCFRCAKCYKPLANEPFGARDDGKIMCGTCGSREDGNRCQACYKVVMPGTQNVEYKNKVWHEECFTCFECKQPIRSQSFLNKGDDIFCGPCHEKKFAKKCFHCKQNPITDSVALIRCYACKLVRIYLAHYYAAHTISHNTGFGHGTNVVNYEGHSWHEYCFNCKKCSLSLANKRFVINGEDIYCPDCAKKL
uniref:Four and a half LIM domains 1a n=1 Tax=Oncorhynchus kisutch TaxID=8019 RepID=A0A8C7DLC0_ONCKI